MLVDFLLATGLGIGKVLAVTWDALDLELATVEVRGTVVRRPGVGGLFIHTTAPQDLDWVAAATPAGMACRDAECARARRQRVDVVFPSQQGKLRDRSNTSSDLRDALDPLGYDWITSHTFRKTAATLLHDGGLMVREVADQLGHSRVSITQDVYFGRGAGYRRAADVLDALGRDESKGVG